MLTMQCKKFEQVLSNGSIDMFLVIGVYRYLGKQTGKIYKFRESSD